LQPCSWSQRCPIFARELLHLEKNTKIQLSQVCAWPSALQPCLDYSASESSNSKNTQPNIPAAPDRGPARVQPCPDSARSPLNLKKNTQSNFPAALAWPPRAPCLDSSASESSNSKMAETPTFHVQVWSSGTALPGFFKRVPSRKRYEDPTSSPCGSSRVQPCLDYLQASPSNSKKYAAPIFLQP
jgi:hypothetical protein